jgi:hypothetical protein
LTKNLCCLLKAGADATATDSTGSTPAAVALLHGHTAAAALLQRAEADQRSKQQQQLAAPLSADRQILGSWQSSIDLQQRANTASCIVAHLKFPEGEWRSVYVKLITRAEFELYRRAADITAYSDVSTLRLRLNQLAADGVILQTQLKQGDDAQTVIDATTAQSGTDSAAAVSTANLTVAHVEAEAQQTSHSAYDSSGSSGSHTGTSSTVNSGHDMQQQQQQKQQQQQQQQHQQQQQMPSTAALITTAAAVLTPLPLALLASSGLQATSGDWRCDERDMSIRNQNMGVFEARLTAAAGGNLSGADQYAGRVLAQMLEATMYSGATSYESYSPEETTQLSAVHHDVLSSSCCAIADSLKAVLRADSFEDARQRLLDEQSLTGAIFRAFSSIRSDAVGLASSSAQSVSNVSDAEAVAQLCTTVTSAHDSESTSLLSCESSEANTAAASYHVSTPLAAVLVPAVAAVESDSMLGDSAGYTQASESDSSCSEAIGKGTDCNSSSSSSSNIDISGKADMTSSESEFNDTDTHTADYCASSSSSSSYSSCASAVNSNSSSSSSSSSSSVSAVNSNNSSSNSSSSEDKWASMARKILQLDAQQTADTAIAVTSTGLVATDIAGTTSSSHTSTACGTSVSCSSGSNTCSSIADISNSSSTESSCDTVTKQLLALQAQRVTAARQHAVDTTLTAAVAAAAVTAASTRVAELNTDSNACAVAAAIAAAEAAAVSASAACSAQAAACKQLQIEMRVQAEQQQCVSSMQHTSAARAAAAVEATTTVTAVSDESDNDDDCPPLAHASNIGLCNNNSSSIVTLAETDAGTAAVVSNNSSNSDSSSHTDNFSSKYLKNEQHKQQQCKQSAHSCMHCGRVTKKRCKRCQAAYYCSEECQIQCFKDPRHRAQCEATAATTAPRF